MISRSGRYVIAYNGEVYNHLDLRLSLESSSRWQGRSDTETLLEGFEQWGISQTLTQAVGMFALAVWDTVKLRLTLARDRLGEKPLFYAQGRFGVAFASEIKALRHVPGASFAVDHDALRTYMDFGYIGSGQSIYRELRKVLPGEIVTLGRPNADVCRTQFWSVPTVLGQDAFASIDASSDHCFIQKIEKLLQQSVHGQMLSDVTLGAFLSGGVDSSLIVAFMQQASARPVRTFSMGFGEAQDETRFARRIATYLGTDHTELAVTPRDVLNLVPELCTIYDEPFADSSQVPTVLLSRLTRQQVTVALSGDGGDELFGGYNRYLAADRLSSIRSRVPRVILAALAELLTKIPSACWDRCGVLLQRLTGIAPPSALGEKAHRFGYMLRAKDDRMAYLAAVSTWGAGQADEMFLRMAERIPRGKVGNLAEHMMWWDIHTYLPDDILVKVDRAAMSCSLETRTPFLDHRVVEAAMALPFHLKVRRGQSKWILREILARHLPRELFERPKQGFTLPIDEWLRGPLRDWAESLLCSSSLLSECVVETHTVRKMWREHLGGLRNHQRAIWAILMLEAWWRQQGSAAS